MIDPFGRTIDYLRVSVTDRCNFRCLYCMPAEGAPFVAREELLSFEEITSILTVAARLGIRKVRLTGGEPLVRREIEELVRQIAGIPGVRDLSMTTNGALLPALAKPLRDAGLRRLNISLDSLDEETCERMSRGGKLTDVLAGIDAAEAAGFEPIKINAVVVRGVNDGEVADLARLSIDRGFHVRFIELMPIGWNDMDEPVWETGSSCASQPLTPTADQDPSAELSQNRGELSAARAFGASIIPLDTVTLRKQAFSTPVRGLETLSFRDLRERFVSSAETRERIEAALGSLEPAEVLTNGPARAFRAPGSKGSIGFISQISHDFCVNCNRMRLTAEGRLRPCLMADGEEDLRDALRHGGGEAEVERRILQALGAKPEAHHLDQGLEPHGRVMSQIGG